MISRPYSLEGAEYELGNGETMHFGFWLHAEMPDSDGDGDNNLDDYYNISILNIICFTIFWSRFPNSYELNNNGKILWF